MNISYTILALIVSIVFFSDSVPESSLREIKLNEIQLIGSHNSYKVAIEQPLLDYLFERDSAIGRSLQYEHIPLAEQLQLGLRSLELDVYHDPEGGYYSNPAGLDIVRSSGNSPLPFDPEEKLKVPGLKVFHVQDIDFRSHQILFKDALTELLAWSEKNPKHTPIMITINTKDGNIPNLRDPLPFDADALQNLDTEIKNVISANKLISPDLVRGDESILEQAILTNGWPALDAVRGRFLFVLDEGDAKIDLYLQKFPGLKEAALFVNKEEGNAEAAFRIVNNPIDSFDKIKSLVAKGYIVRTRADAGTEEARNNDYTRFERAKASGAQVITTDYYLPSKLFKSDFKVVFNNGKYERIGN
ncbi:phosphatidylinositol-specific phospholipase C1-like protein [Parapedobacter sp. DT-150]|uniref:phosphatidylinositol-specific phospholipase C1-like protein n=1 Tax=Parapedobacter sp. DT-150 TaxID=3396162 RepID=UPI003F197E6C